MKGQWIAHKFIGGPAADTTAVSIHVPARQVAQVQELCLQALRKGRGERTPYVFLKCPAQLDPRRSLFLEVVSTQLNSLPQEVGNNCWKTSRTAPSTETRSSTIFYWTLPWPWTCNITDHLWGRKDLQWMPDKKPYGPWDRWSGMSRWLWGMRRAEHRILWRSLFGIIAYYINSLIAPNCFVFELILSHLLVSLTKSRCGVLFVLLLKVAKWLPCYFHFSGLQFSQHQLLHRFYCAWLTTGDYYLKQLWVGQWHVLIYYQMLNWAWNLLYYFLLSHNFF